LKGLPIRNPQSAIRNPSEGPRVIPVDPAAPEPAAVAEAAALLRAGALVGFPTDTLYALGADPFQPGALARVFEAKGREVAKAVSLLVADAAMAARLAGEIPLAARVLMDRLWPGALTLVLPPRPGLPQALVPNGGGVGVRAPQGAVARALLALFGGPVVGTSANRAGGPDARDAILVVQAVGPHLALVLDGGPTPVGVPSTVIDCTTRPPIILRPGAVPLEAIQAILPDVLPSVPSHGPRKS
jgi:L-threonylcarbamoyladenylate synthase